MNKQAEWKTERVGSSELKSARRLLLGSGLPIQGLKETELWCVKDREGHLIGIAGLETWGKQGLLRSVVVDQLNRNSGMGKALVERVLKEAKANGLDELYLLTETAPNFFARFGFKPVERTSVKGNVLNSIEFREVCPDTAPMRLALN
jgi:amino-acid N-acetyltransferase